MYILENEHLRICLPAKEVRILPIWFTFFFLVKRRKNVTKKKIHRLHRNGYSFGIKS